MLESAAGRLAGRLKLLLAKLLWLDRRGFWGLVGVAATGLALGATARLFFLCMAPAGQVGHHRGPGIPHYIVGYLSGLGLPLQGLRAFSERLALFFISYQAGEWLLGDQPLGEYRHFIIGASLGLLAGLIVLALGGVVRRLRVLGALA